MPYEQKPKRWLLLTYFFSLMLSLSNLSNATPTHWQPLHSGVTYTYLEPKELSPFAQLHVFKINLKKANITFCEMSEKATSAKQAALINQALIATNGAFFASDHSPLGLRVKNGLIKSAIKPVSWWGVFYVKKNRAKIIKNSRYRHSKSISFAIQAGPRLLINGKIPALKKGLAERTAIGITTKGEIILLVSEHALMSTTFLAKLMRDELNCVYALNLDGGSSSQLFAHIGDFKRSVLSFARVPTPLCVFEKPRKKQ